ncbi:MAG: glycosyltransferase [Micromonosporaceae bacterium]|nr:glycosyltransferase [Micromonosporaceae bacterium]
MRVLMLSWEYPPVMVGGLGRHVHALATSLVTAGHHVTVVTRHGADAPLEEEFEGVRIVRAPEDPPLFPLSNDTLLAWTMAFNHALTRAALHAAKTADGPHNRPFDIVHAHDWLVTHAAVTLKHSLGVPLIATIHATEAGRHQGWLPEQMNRCVHSVEWWLTYEARRVLVCSAYMRWEVSRLFDLPRGKVEVICNGVHAEAWRPSPRAVAAARSRFGGEGPLVVYAGRLVYEKGVQDLLAAVPALRDRHPGLRVVIAGDGPHREGLEQIARRRRIRRTAAFTGFLEGDELAGLLAAADCLVAPSRYEPFGMVALEAAAAGAPVAAASAGGLAEFVQPGITGLTFPAADVGALAEAVDTLLSDEVLARRLTRQARALVIREYAWPAIAERTVSAYQRAVTDERALSARVAAGGGPRPRIVVPNGNLLTGEAASP